MSDIEEDPSGATTHPTGGAGTGPKREVPDLALTVREAAKALHVPYKAVLRLIHSGELAAKKPGKEFIVGVSEIQRYLVSKPEAA